MRAFGRHFRDIRPAVTLVEIARLARPTQLIEIEAEAIVGAVRYLPRGHRGSAGDGGAILNDVIQRRSFTIASAEQNRPYGEGPAWSKDSWPV